MGKKKSLSTASSGTSFRRDTKPSSSASGASSAKSKHRGGGGGGSGGGGGKKSAWSEPTAAEMQQQIASSRLPVRLALRVHLVDDDGTSAPLWTTMALSSSDDGMATIPLLECGINSWEELLEMQRLLERPSSGAARLQCRVKRTPPPVDASTIAEDREETPEDKRWVHVELQAPGVDAVWRQASELTLRLQSLGLPTRSLLADPIKLSPWEAQVNSRCSELDCEGELECHELVVTSSPTIRGTPEQVLHRVKLPSQRQRSPDDEDPIAAIRYPALLSLVDEMLAINAETGASQVVILRGIPGSGKSSLGREIATIARSRGADAVICSADTHFETPRGYVFNPKGLQQAHEQAQRSFVAAIRGDGRPRAKIVVVDNTNTQRWEYETYEKAAQQQKCSIYILEMRCADVPTCLRMAQRNSHGVPAVKVVAMFQRWEHDTRARVFTPQFEFPLLTPNPITRPALKRGHYHVAYVGLFLEDASRRDLLSLTRPRHSNVIAEHVTMYYRPTIQYIRSTPVGMRVTVEGLNVVEDDRGQALEVSLDAGLPIPGKNKVPHVTISTGEGVSAYYSNDLLARQDLPRVPVSHEKVSTLNARVGVVMMAQNNKIVGTISQFDTSLASKSSGNATVVLVMRDSEVLLCSASPNDAVLPQRILQQAMLYNGMGVQQQTRRVLCIISSSGSSSVEPELRKCVEQTFALNSQCLLFDAVVSADDTDSLQTELSRSPNVTVLTTVDAVELPSKLRASLSTAGAEQCLRHVPSVLGDPDAIGRLADTSSMSMTRALDRLNLAITEEACFVVSTAISKVTEAVKTLRGTTSTPVVSRVDSVLMATPRNLVDLVMHPSYRGLIGESLADQLQTSECASVVVDTSANTIYFELSLPTLVSSPVFRLYCPPEGHRDLEIVENLHHRVVTDLSPEAQETYSKLAPILTKMLHRGCVPNIGVTWVSKSITLLAERAVASFLTIEDEEGSSSSVSSKDLHLDSGVLWSRFVKMINTLASWPNTQWKSELDTTLLSPGIDLSESVLKTAASKIAELIPTTLARTRDLLDTITTESDQPAEGFLSTIHRVVQDVHPSMPCFGNEVMVNTTSCTTITATHRLIDRLQAVLSNESPANELVWCSVSPVIRGSASIFCTSEEALSQVMLKAQEILTLEERF
ncbi:hypothetical protein PINS_up012457 [Pythium insidiosum]|nr:hypothetical protein PINS_up012457 [Pythium insidiosum]